MAKSTDNSSEAQVESHGMRERLIAIVQRLFTWSTQSRLRLILVGGALIISLLGIFVFWSYMAQLAVDQNDRPSLAQALSAYDEGRLEDARSIVGHMQNESSPELFGGALFVLGAVKASEADAAPGDERRRGMHVVAARYLQKARALGVPPAREQQAKFLHARSLILGRQGEIGIPLLQELITDGVTGDAEIDALLVHANLHTPDPHLQAALAHSERALANDALSDADRADMELERVNILARLGLLDEARTALASGDVVDTGARQLLAGRLDVSAAERLPADAPERALLLASGRASLEGAESSDALGGPVTRQAMYWIGRAYVLESNEFLAREKFNRLSKLYADTPEGLVAQLEEAQLDRNAGQNDRALDAYRAVLDSVRHPERFINPLISLTELRRWFLDAHQHFVDSRLFGEAQTLVDQLTPLFHAAEQRELVAETHKSWGDAIYEEANRKGHWASSQLLRDARTQYRAAGRAYEDLARLRFATRSFPNDLWLASENYFRGQSFTHAERLIEEYLKHEARRLGAHALLRLGQCRLSANQPKLAIEALTECLDAYPDDAMVFRARLECARAERQLNRFARAESLLEQNLSGDALTPESLDWRDSLFEAGDLMYETGRYEEAIRRLDEAVARYPDVDEATMAQYTIARANHAAAEAPAKNLGSAKTENERQKNRQQLTDYLQAALDAYLAVQRSITLSGQSETSPLHRRMLRNCYMMQGAVLYELKRFEDAQKAFANVSNLYQNSPFVLESYVQMANCWRSLDEPVKARGTIRLARSALENMPGNADFRSTTNFTRQEWQFVLDSMYRW